MRFIAASFIIFSLFSCTALGNIGPKYFMSGIFVSVNTGNDTNAGTNSAAPVKSIRTGISNAIVLGYTNIYLAAGVYTPGNGLNPATYGVVITNNNISLYGGCDLGFTTSRNGYSEWDCQRLVGPVVFIQNASNVIIDRMVIRNGMTNQYSSGVVIKAASNVNLVDSVISNNSNSVSILSAGGIYITNSSISINNCQIVNNYGWTGGIFYSDCEYRIENCFLGNNSGSSNGGALHSYIGNRGVLSDNRIINNNADFAGGVFIFRNKSLIMKNNVITNNYSFNNVYDSSLVISSETGLTNLMISNCLLGGTNHSTQLGIRDFNVGSCKYVLLYNTFITNSLSELYQNGATSVTLTDWTNINDTNWIGAAVASGNRVTNL
jgi:hypothetical protein